MDRDEFDNSADYEEAKKLYKDKAEFDEMLKETLFYYSSPTKDQENDYIEANLFVSPQKSEMRQNQKPFKKKVLNFKRTKSNKENQHR